uniref:Prospero-like protein n=1 Tax=Schistosoma mansoni TaxID=6183 RepID=A0A3Q0KRG2_SCHMA
MLTNTTTSTSSSCNPVTAAAAAAALANVLGFPIPYGWSPKILTDVQDAYGLISNPYYHWPWKLLNSPYAPKYSDQNTLLQSGSLVNNTINIIERLNKVNPESTLDSCLKSKFPLNDENKQNNIMMFNDATSLSTQATSSDEQVEAIPLIVRHDRKVNKSGPVINSNGTIYNSCSSNLTTSTNVTTAPITNESNSFHGPTISRRRRTKVTDTRLTHSRVSRCPNNAFSNFMMTNSVMQQNNRHHHNQPISQQQSFLQSNSESIDLGQALNLVTSTSTSFGLSGNQLLADDKESLLTSQSLLPGINPAKYRNSVVSTSTTTGSNINNTSNVKLDDFYSAKYRSENQVHSSGSNNSSPSPISLRLSGYSKELTDNTSENRKGHCHENVDISELDKNNDYQLNGADEKLHCLNILQEYKSFEKMFTKTLKNYPLSAKSNLLDNIGTLPAVMNIVSSSTPSTYSPSVFKDINTSLEVTTSTSLSISSIFPTSSSTTSLPVTSPCSSACSDINQRTLLSRFNQICLLNSRLPNSLPSIPPIFFNPTEDTINNNFNHISNNNTNNTNKFSTGNFYDHTSIQSNGQERQQQSLSHSFEAKNNLSFSHPHNLSLSSSLPRKSPSPYSQSLQSSIFSPSQSLASVIGSIDYNTVITTAANNSIDHNNNNNNNNITTISSLQNKHQRLQQNLPNLNSKRHHNHMSYINKLYDKFNANENLRNIKLDKSLLLNDNFSGESTSGMTISESYQNQLINYSHELRMTTTLTPVHLRKAKLMFFYTRYPNSTLIKMYFPDVKFYKNNTAQLVKWFSNFREFYYIQMEKYARVAISEGIRIADEIHVTIESEIYRALNLHYNRNQQLEVPDHFRIVVEATLREFFNALYTGKDSEQSWKKPIYKVIARMDQPVPEFFKSPNWMDQLADG